MTENEKINGWTFEETIKTVENVMEVENNMFKWDVLRHLRDFTESFKYELEQYRAIGTVEDIRNTHLLCEVFSSTVRDYTTIGTVEEFKALKEKNVAKKPIPIDYKKYIGVIENAKFLRGAYWCPNCKHTVRSGSYCDDCGQKLDWQ